MQFTHVALLIGMAVTTGARADGETLYNVDVNHTFAIYETDHLGMTTNRGRFNVKDGGKVNLDRGAGRGSVDLTIDMASLSTGIEALNAHMKNRDFLNTAQFPTARFVSDKFVFSGDKLSEVQGQLTMLGKTLPVTLKARKFGCLQDPMLRRERCGADLEATIQRSQWGVKWGLQYGFPDETKLLLQVETLKD